MPKPVYLLTVQEAHKEYNSLTDQIWAKYTCSCEPTLPETGPATSKGILQAHILQALKTLFGSKLQAGSSIRVWRMQLCSHRYERITGLLSAPLV